MNFYKDWQNAINDHESNQKFIKEFLNKTKNSKNALINGTKEELIIACKTLISIPISEFILCIDKVPNFTPDSIVQFSNLDNAITQVCRVLNFKKDGMTFCELGKEIIKAVEYGACNKYGENHSKVAEEINMVYFEKTGSIKVYLTQFGKFSINLSSEDRIELMKRLMLRNDFIKTLIYYASNEYVVSYMDIAQKVLSKSTALRRKSNVRQIVNYILEDDKEIMNKIVW